MKRLFLAVLAMISVAEVFACTNLLVSKGASKDGSVMVSYAADSHTRYGTLVYMPRGFHKRGEMIEVSEAMDLYAIWILSEENIRRESLFLL